MARTDRTGQGVVDAAAAVSVKPSVVSTAAPSLSVARTLTEYFVWSSGSSTAVEIVPSAAIANFALSVSPGPSTRLTVNPRSSVKPGLRTTVPTAVQVDRDHPDAPVYRGGVLTSTRVTL